MSLVIVDYTEKAIAVFGETKFYKNKITEIGGKFNPSLTWDNEKKPGWIFSKSKRSIVQELINDINQGKIEKEPTLSYKENKDKKVSEEKKSVENQDIKTTFNIHRMKDELNGIFVSKKDFMNLVSKIERLEQEVAILKDNKEIKNEVKNTQKYPGMVNLSSSSSSSKQKIMEEQDDVDSNEEEILMEKARSLLRGKK